MEISKCDVSTLSIATTDHYALVTLVLHWKGISHFLVTLQHHEKVAYMCLLSQDSPWTELSWEGVASTDSTEIQVYGLLQKEMALTEDVNSLELFSVQVLEKNKISVKSLDETTQSLKISVKTDTGSSGRKKHMKDNFGTKCSFETSILADCTLKLHRCLRDKNFGLFVIFCEETKEEFLLMSKDLKTRQIPLKEVLQSRRTYSISSVLFRLPTMIHFRHGLTANSTSQQPSRTNVKIGMDKQHIHCLLEKAKLYCKTQSRKPKRYKINKLYRNKTPEYFSNIMDNENGVMAKYLKDNNGDPFSVINLKIDGLFFSTSLTLGKKKPLNTSYYGSKRLFLPAEEMIGSNMRLYFADFYCHYLKVHYVTIVLTKRGSPEDKFCEERLVELDSRNNPFFTVNHAKQRRTFKVVSVKQFHVELFYTEDVDIKGLQNKLGSDKVYFKSVTPLGRGHSKKGGIPKNSQCPVCNL